MTLMDFPEHRRLFNDQPYRAVAAAFVRFYVGKHYNAGWINKDSLMEDLDEFFLVHPEMLRHEVEALERLQRIERGSHDIPRAQQTEP